MLCPPRSLHVLCTLLGLGAALAVHPASGDEIPDPADTLRIGTIRILARDVYTAEEGSAGWPYRAASALHIHTRPGTIRKFLLFAEGEVYDPERMAQTERNLRSQIFLKSATIRTVPGDRPGVVDVEVETQDTWTTEPRVAVSRAGGETTFGFSVLERNLLGTGRKVKYSYDEEVYRIRRFLEFIDPHFVYPYLNARVVHAFNSDGHEDLVTLTRPFAATSDRRRMAVGYGDAILRDRIYRSGGILSEFRVDQTAVSAEAGFAPTATSHGARRLLGGVSYSRVRFDSTGVASTQVPEDREFAYLYLRTEFLETRLTKLDYVNRDARFEDFDLGWRVSLLAGVSPEAFGLDRTTGVVTLEASEGIALGPHSLATLDLGATSRLGAPRNNTQIRGELRGVRRFPGRFPQTLVGRLEAVRGWDLDPDLQFFADGDNGLRAYRLFAYEGNRRILFNLEHRVFLGSELFQILAPGAAVFFDAGAAVPEDRSFTWRDVKRDVGIGLRLALPRASEHDLIRIDLAVPLDRDPFGNRDPLLSFSSEQAF